MEEISMSSDVTDGTQSIRLKEQHNPVLDGAAFVYERQTFVELNYPGIEDAARYIRNRIDSESYAPWTWRTHPLHLCPPMPYSPDDPKTKACLDWIFLVSSLNFSFWSELEGRGDQYGVEWRAGWQSESPKVWTGYWSLLASLNKAIERGIPILDATFYSTEEECPDSLIGEICRPATQSAEIMPMLSDRVRIIRENGKILCDKFGGSFKGFVDEFRRSYQGKGTALDFVRMVTSYFPSFRDECQVDGKLVHFWKRPQILVAEMWAAFHPLPDSGQEHPYFPLGVDQLTMFADYRVPQILHHLRILSYSSELSALLIHYTPFPSGSLEEMSIRAGAILAVEAVKNFLSNGDEDVRDGVQGPGRQMVTINSVLIDFYLWDLAKRLETGEDSTDSIQTVEMLPAHRTRSIWY